MARTRQPEYQLSSISVMNLTPPPYSSFPRVRTSLRRIRPRLMSAGLPPPPFPATTPSFYVILFQFIVILLFVPQLWGAGLP
ncbi:hypothetical protein K439DRAFT_1637803 [Ramaria rubella]|nr:hypothetical protein K439DRAFT_1637803 [Ramaria rubella]